MHATASNTPVPPLNLAAQFRELRAELLAEITEICDSGYYILGPKVQAFEEALAAYTGAKFALGVSSGTDALLLAMMALEIGPGDEVIVPAFTFFASAGTVSRVGARPVFCDIDPVTFNIDIEDAARKVSPRTKAAVPVHLYGQMMDVQRLEQALRAAAGRPIAIIEDAAQSLGAREAPGGRMSGTLGAFGAISFYPTKNLGAIGDAGALLTNDAALHERAKQLRLHGETVRYHHKYVGGNFRIDALQAAILNIKLRRLDGWTEQRRQRAAAYDSLFEAAGLVPESLTPPRTVFGTHVFHQYTIRCRRRDELVKRLVERKIGYGIYYPVPLHLQECFASLGGQPGDHPHAEAAAREVLSLPMYPELTREQQESVVATVREFFRG